MSVFDDLIGGNSNRNTTTKSSSSAFDALIGGGDFEFSDNPYSYKPIQRQPLEPSPTPEAVKAQQFLNMPWWKQIFTKNTARELPGAAKETGKAILRAAPQAAVRTAVEINKKLAPETDIGGYTPSSRFAKIVLGGDKIQGFQKYGKDTTSMIEGLGVKNASKNKYVNTAVGLGMTAMDLFPLGVGMKYASGAKIAGKTAVKEATEAGLKTVAKEDLGFTTKSLKDGKRIPVQDLDKSHNIPIKKQNTNPLSNEARQYVDTEKFGKTYYNAGEHGKYLYHETSPQNATRLTSELRGGNKVTYMPDVTNNPDLAIGQSNKGVTVVFDANKSVVRDKINQKPGAGFLQSQGITDELKLRDGEVAGIIVKKGTPIQTGANSVNRTALKAAGLDLDNAVTMPNGDTVFVKKGVNPNDFYPQPLSTTPKTTPKTGGQELLEELNSKPRAKTTKISESKYNTKEGGDIYMEMANAEAGKRMRGEEVMGAGNTFTTVSQKSSFPDWVPKSMRSKKLFDTVQEHITNGTIPTNRKERRLYQIVKDELDVRLGEKPSLAKIKDELTPPVTTGEMKTSKLALGVREKAIENRLRKSLGDLPEYQKVDMAEQAKFSKEFLDIDEEAAIRVALGEETPPAHILPESIFTAVEERAIADKNVDLIRQLANSSRTTEASAMGQRIRALAERSPNSPSSLIREISDERIRAIEKITGKKTTEQIKIVSREIKSNIPKVTKQTWSSFVEELRCK